MTTRKTAASPRSLGEAAPGPGPAAGEGAAGSGPARMTDEAAAWIREHAWPPVLRRLYDDTPGYLTTCPAPRPPRRPHTWTEETP